MFRNEGLNNLLVRLLGGLGTLVPGDPSIFDRWLWLRGSSLDGHVRTLDAGCGSGVFGPYAARLGNEIVVISENERNHRVAGERASLIGVRRAQFPRDLRELDRFADELGRFDQIICCETIEHIIDDQKLINDLATMLNPAGSRRESSRSKRPSRET